MNVINHLAPPGQIKKVELRLDTVRVSTRDGAERLYRYAGEPAKPVIGIVCKEVRK